MKTRKDNGETNAASLVEKTDRNQDQAIERDKVERGRAEKKRKNKKAS